MKITNDELDELLKYFDTFCTGNIAELSEDKIYFIELANMSKDEFVSAGKTLHSMLSQLQPRVNAIIIPNGSITKIGELQVENNS